MAARSSSVGGGVISRSTSSQAKVFAARSRSEVSVGRGLPAAIAALALVHTGAAAASGQPDRSWAAPQIQTVTAAGLMGTKTPATFRPNDALTAQALANLVFGLSQVLFPPPPILPVE